MTGMRDEDSTKPTIGADATGGNHWLKRPKHVPSTAGAAIPVRPMAAFPTRTVLMLIPAVAARPPQRLIRARTVLTHTSPSQTRPGQLGSVVIEVGRSCAKPPPTKQLKYDRSYQTVHDRRAGCGLTRRPAARERSGRHPGCLFLAVYGTWPIPPPGAQAPAISRGGHWISNMQILQVRARTPRATQLLHGPPGAGPDCPVGCEWW